MMRGCEQVEWYCAQACSGVQSAAEASGTWLPGAVVPEEQCWATAHTICDTEIDASLTPLQNEGNPPAYVNGGTVSYVNTGR